MSQQRALTAGEECQQAAKAFSAFVDPRQGAIPSVYITSAMGCAICKGNRGVAVLRLKTGEWSAPCAIELEQQNGAIQQGQETVLLFMTESVIHKLVARALLRLGVTDQFRPGPLTGNEPINPAVDVYGWVRFNGGFTPPELIAQNMVSWFVREDPERHGRWHGESVTWFDVLTNKITVDRSSVGNALYVVLNMAAGSNAAVDVKRKNFADLDALSGIAPSVITARAQKQQQQQQQHQYQQQQQQQSPQQFQQQQYLQQQHQLQQQQLQQQLLQQQQQLAGLSNPAIQGYPSPQLYQQSQPQQNLYQPQQQQQLYTQAAQPTSNFSYEQALQQQALAHQQYAAAQQQVAAAQQQLAALGQFGGSGQPSPHQQPGQFSQQQGGGVNPAHWNQR
ncbi:uncharacterized protein EV422DRAFT_526143 [Fimicolochytrium jonesii]|uniref:uncharacterized protein n=1 Tax=Fimicolochytrium jonesii TaxID=1396493 RepID=UPI0022FF1675|nr:uncharacterized protein EV422DRAFT_526143 [Fimicolochytrium jonesii]KAI8822227.1 hypothetical protein EV422DRAFT_526143 [Fimicolochytrium jonesii]